MTRQRRVSPPPRARQKVRPAPWSPPGTEPHPRALLGSLELTARKSMGQNFLTSSEVPAQIVALADVTAEDWVLEVGPGLGALTLALEAAGARVLALEKDRGLASWLQRRFEGHERVRILEQDVLEWTPDSATAAQLGQVTRRRAIANLPYNVAVPILFHLLELEPGFTDLTLMVQREVAQRMAALPDTEQYGVLTLMLGRRATVRTLLEVPPGAFFPSPKVVSCVVSVRPHEVPPAPMGSPGMFERVVRGAFGERRKTLRNALTAAGFSREQVLRALERVGVDPGRRGETLDLETFSRLSVAFSEE